MHTDPNLTSYSVTLASAVYSVVFLAFTVIQLGIVGASHANERELEELRLTSLVLLLVSAVIFAIPPAFQLISLKDAESGGLLWLIQLALVVWFYTKAPIRFKLLAWYRLYDIADLLLHKTPCADSFAADESLPENQMGESVPKPEQQKKSRQRRMSKATLDQCTDAMQHWLEEGKTLPEASALAGTTEKTVRKWIFNILDTLEEEKREKWEKILRALKEIP